MSSINDEIMRRPKEAAGLPLFLTLDEAARHYGIPKKYLADRARSGVIHSIRAGRGGAIRLAREAVDKVLGLA